MHLSFDSDFNCSLSADSYLQMARDSSVFTCSMVLEGTVKFSCTSQYRCIVCHFSFFCTRYYNLAHAVNERVIKQPSMLRAGTLRDYQLVSCNILNIHTVLTFFSKTRCSS